MMLMGSANDVNGCAAKPKQRHIF